MIRRPPRSTLFPYTDALPISRLHPTFGHPESQERLAVLLAAFPEFVEGRAATEDEVLRCQDRKSTRLNSSHLVISYAVFCLKKKKNSKTDLATMYARTPATQY